MSKYFLLLFLTTLVLGIAAKSSPIVTESGTETARTRVQFTITDSTSTHSSTVEKDGILISTIPVVHAPTRTVIVTRTMSIVVVQ